MALPLPAQFSEYFEHHEKSDVKNLLGKLKKIIRQNLASF